MKQLITQLLHVTKSMPIFQKSHPSCETSLIVGINQCITLSSLKLVARILNWFPDDFFVKNIFLCQLKFQSEMNYDQVHQTIQKSFVASKSQILNQNETQICA